MQFGITTHPWSEGWELSTLVENLTKADISGIELHVENGCGIDIGLDKKERREARKILKNNSIQIIGLNSDEHFDHPSPERLRDAIDRTMECIKLSADMGGGSVGIKQGRFHPHIPKSRTVYQIGRTLNQLGRMGTAYNQQIRLIIDGPNANIEAIKDIMDIAEHPNVTVSWSSNPGDLRGKGLEANFELLQNRLGDIVYVHEMNDPAYPYNDLIRLLVNCDYRGWVMFKAQTNPPDKVNALIEQRKIFEQLLGKAIIS